MASPPLPVASPPLPAASPPLRRHLLRLSSPPLLKPRPYSGTLTFISVLLLLLLLASSALLLFSSRRPPPPSDARSGDPLHNAAGGGEEEDGAAAAAFYQPKSTESAVFSEKGRPYSPWSRAAIDSLRTAFHFQPESNWMNDPNAPLYYKGWYHLFYQYNPNDAFWGIISWGHAVSTDLIHWLYLDLAMVPDKWYDIRGVWTGSATFTTADGAPTVLYTGSTNGSVQVQNLAVPADPSDPLLQIWTKDDDHNPVLLPPDGILDTDFRDPTTAWLGSDGLWRLAIGSKVNDTGIALIYSSADFVSWELQENYLHQVDGTGMWECVDFYPVYKSGDSAGVDTSVNGDGVKHVIKASMDNSKLDYYTIGEYDSVNHKFTADYPPADLGLGLRYDYGKFYASKTFYDNSTGRRILWGWVNESDSLQDDIDKGWASVQALPRQIWFDNLTQANLIQWPVEEFADLRRSNVTVEDVILESGAVVAVPGGSGMQLDIELTIENPVAEAAAESDKEEEAIYGCGEVSSAKQGYYGPFGLLVLASEDLEEQTAIYFYFTRINGNWTALICNDITRSTKATEVDKFIYGSFVPVLESEKELSLRVVVDHSIVETFAQGGRVCITSRVYPTVALDDDAHLFAFNNGSAAIRLLSLRAWQISSVFFHPFSSLHLH